MPKCVYCKQDYSIPRGLTLVMKDGTINHLCSSKCKKNMLMKRRKVRWILKDKKDTRKGTSKVAEVKEVVKEEKVEVPKEEKVVKVEVPKEEKKE